MCGITILITISITLGLFIGLLEQNRIISYGHNNESSLILEIKGVFNYKKLLYILADCFLGALFLIIVSAVGKEQDDSSIDNTGCNGKY